MVGISVLIWVDAYIIQIFFKTVFLVITLSLLHGIVFLPIFLTIALPICECCKNEIKQHKEIKKSDENYIENLQYEEINLNLSIPGRTCTA